MREILTVVAGLVVAVLAALLAVPPLIDWPAHRDRVDGALSRIVGAEVRTEGRLSVRLLPSPQIKARRIRLGRVAEDSPSVDAMYVRAEIALTSLIAGEWRLRDARIGRAEIKLPAGAGGDFRIPGRLLAGVATAGPWVVEDMYVAQLLVTTVDTRTGRTDQAYAEGARIQASSLAGPWRLDATTGAVPFELALGEIGPDLSAPVKLGGGGGALPRFDIDGRLAMSAAPDDVLVPRFAGTGKLATPPPRPGAAALRLPVQVQAAIEGSGRALNLSNLVVEAGEGAGSLRLTGSGDYRIDGSRLTLALSGRRFDAAAFWSQHAGLMKGGASGWPPWPAISGSLRLESMGIGTDEDVSGMAVQASSASGRLRIDALEAAGPGGAALRGEGEVSFLAGGPSGSGRVTLAARDSDRLGRFLAPFGLDAAGLLDGRPLDASADVTVADPVVSLRNLRVALGDAVLSGTLRHQAAEAGQRARLDAQLAIRNVDIAALPDAGPLFAAARDRDLGLTIDARGVAYGPARGGRISGRLATDGGAILLDGLSVRDLAGAEADLAGRISPDGGGRIEGRLKAARAAPLIDLFGRAWLGGLARLVPTAARDGPVDLAVAVSRVAAGAGAPRSLRTLVTGTLAGGTLEATTVAAGGELTELSAVAATQRFEGWFGRASGDGAARPGALSLSARRVSGRLAASLRGDLGGVRLETSRPVTLGGDDDTIEGGEFAIASDDLSPLLTIAGFPIRGPTPATLSAELSRRETLRAAISGDLAGVAVRAALGGPSVAEIGGDVSLGRLSLPWLASALALNVPSQPSGGPSWGTARFGPRLPPPVGGSVTVRATTLDLGGGSVGQDASFALATTPDGFRIGDLDLTLAGGRLRGAFGIERGGGLASLIGEGSVENLPVSAILGAPFGPGRLSGRLRFGASGESPAGLVANLGGAGEMALDGVSVAGADPGGVERVASRLLRSDDPLASARWQPLLAEELGRGPLASARIAANASLVGGALRLSPVVAAAEAGAWQGSATFDLKTTTLDARGALQSTASPRNWTGPPPTVSLGWSGPFARPVRTVDPGPLVNALASLVLGRELDRIDTFELDAAERQRRNARTEMERQRRLAAEEATRLARLKAEADERARLEAERRRLEAERQRLEAERQRQETERRASPPPLDIRPPAQGLAPSGGG